MWVRNCGEFESRASSAWQRRRCGGGVCEPALAGRAGKTQPSVSTLYALVNYLGISLDGLMGTSRGESGGLGISPVGVAPEGASARRSDSIVQRRADNPIIEMENGVTWERMAVGESSVADPLIVTYQPAGSSSIEGKMMRHAGLEYGVLLDGRLTLRIDFEKYDLEPGDSFCFDSNRRHLYVTSPISPRADSGS